MERESKKKNDDGDGEGSVGGNTCGDHVTDVSSFSEYVSRFLERVRCILDFWNFLFIYLFIFGWQNRLEGPDLIRSFSF